MIVHRLPPPPSYGTMPLGRVYRSTTRGVASVWNGELSPRVYLNSTFSCKIFLGGVPRDVTEPTLVEVKPLLSLKYVLANRPLHDIFLRCYVCPYIDGLYVCSTVSIRQLLKSDLSY
ncbi:unnamed protein product [Toxocara canis]|uniref:Uncharacterized protein n=1 Tax=Toxocara canis TaxID=6265 RepID=A0A183U9U7_TOXCA|nr:unnamed protein product [Toxocara canis]